MIGQHLQQLGATIWCKSSQSGQPPIARVATQNVCSFGAAKRAPCSPTSLQTGQVVLVDAHVEHVSPHGRGAVKVVAPTRGQRRRREWSQK